MFRIYALRCLDAVLAHRLGVSLEAARGTPRYNRAVRDFDIMELGPMAPTDAYTLLDRGSEGMIPDAVAARTVELTAGHPFYLQVLGEELVALGEPVDESAFREATQRVLFSSVVGLGCTSIECMLTWWAAGGRASGPYGLCSDTRTFGKGEDQPEGPELFSHVPGPAKARSK